jgi:hypothetical protein
MLVRSQPTGPSPGFVQWQDVRPITGESEFESPSLDHVDEVLLAARRPRKAQARVRLPPSAPFRPASWCGHSARLKPERTWFDPTAGHQATERKGRVGSPAHRYCAEAIGRESSNLSLSFTLGPASAVPGLSIRSWCAGSAVLRRLTMPSHFVMLASDGIAYADHARAPTTGSGMRRIGNATSFMPSSIAQGIAPKRGG